MAGFGEIRRKIRQIHPRWRILI